MSSKVMAMMLIMMTKTIITTTIASAANWE